MGSLQIGLPVLLKTEHGRPVIGTVYGQNSLKTYRGLYHGWVSLDELTKLIDENTRSATRKENEVKK